MTALNGPIVFNSSTGSDTAASGCGPATAVSVMIQTSAGSNTANASWTGTISAGDLMYIPDSSFTGRKFNVIASVGSGSLTFDDNWDDSSFGTSGYVGGKRATLGNADQLFQYTYFDGKTIEVELETDQTVGILSGTGSSGSRNVTVNIRSNTSGTKRKITATDAYLMEGGKYTATDIAFESTYSSNSYVGRSHSSNGGFFGTFVDCSFSSAVNSFYNVVSLAYPSQVRAYRTEFANFTDRVFNNMQICYIDSCLFRNNGNYCLGNSSNGAYSFDVSNSIFDNNVGFVYNFSGLSARITNNIINNTTTNLFGTGYGGDFEFFVNNIFSNNAGSISANVASGTSRMYGNAYYNNANIDASFNGNYSPITLTADPFVDAANGDFNLNNALGGGATLRSTKYTLGG